MIPEPVDKVDDPKRLRALAHPLRWDLISLLDAEDTATATRCAEVLGQSVASCSYHLNMLAKYGFVEEAAGGQGREKPWKLTTRSHRLSGDGLDLEGQLAAEAATEAFVDHEFAKIKDRIRRRSSEPAEWRKPTGITDSTLYLTPAEAQEIRHQFQQIGEQFAERRDDPGKRPEGTRLVRLFMSAFLEPQYPGKD